MAQPLVFIGGYLSQPSDFIALAAELERPHYNYCVFITPIGRIRWALTRDWDFRPVISMLARTVQYALAETGAEQLTILAYSVGGVTARIYLGDQPYLGSVYDGRRYVSQLITLGTPHTSLERWTAKLYGFVDATYPGAFYDDVRYVSIVGKALQGRKDGTLRERMARASYLNVAGAPFADGWGDGITAVANAILPGAEFLAVSNVYHSPFHGKPWYGDPEALAQWSRVL